MSCPSRHTTTRRRATLYLMSASLTAMLMTLTASAFTHSSVGRAPAFTNHRPSLLRKQQLLHLAGMDPTDLVQSAASALEHTETLASTVETALNTVMVSSAALTIDVDVSNLHPAHEHTQPLWGPPDPFLSAGRSIVPNGIPTAQPPIETTLVTPEWITQATSMGYQVRDGATMTQEPVLPGFAPVRGILGVHKSGLEALQETPESFAAQVEWSARFLSVIDKLPVAAFYYALVEFFLLRPNLDVAQEEVQEDFVGLTAETVAVTSVRVGVFCVIAIFTWGIFG